MAGNNNSNECRESRKRCYVKSAAKVTKRVWVHLGVVKNLKNVSFFVDGVKDSGGGNLERDDITYSGNNYRYFGHSAKSSFRNGEFDFLDESD